MSRGWTYVSGDWNLIYKKCSVCNAEKDITNFYKNIGGKFGVRSDCIVCFHEKRKGIPKDKSKSRMYSKKYREANPEKVKEATNNWRKNNLLYDAYRAKVYRTRKSNQCPVWSDLDKIKEIYLNCPLGYHVDHIIPLKGTKASGLHVPENLQYLLPKENLSKRNLYGWDEV